MIYRFSPDFRPKRLFVKMCACCRRQIHDTAKAVPVTLDWNEWTVAQGHDQHAQFKNHPSPEIHNEYFGAQCWKRTVKDGRLVERPHQKGKSS